MVVDDKLIEYLEESSYLTLNGDERLKIKKDLEEILASLSILSQLDTEGVPECSQPLDHVNALREDEVRPHLDRALALQNAPFKNEEMIIAPKTVD